MNGAATGMANIVEISRPTQQALKKESFEYSAVEALTTIPSFVALHVVIMAPQTTATATMASAWRSPNKMLILFFA